MSSRAATTAMRALVVGGTSGIGRAIAVQIATSNPDSHVVIASRGIESAAKDLASLHPSIRNISYAKVDCLSTADIKRFTTELAKTHTSTGPFDMLILSAGILSTAGLTLTEDRVDKKMMLHYYSRMLIVRELLTANCLSASATIMSVLDGKKSDPGSTATGAIEWGDMSLTRDDGVNYSLARCAAHCTAFTDLQLATFAGQSGNADRLFLHAWPGIVRTNLASSLPWYMRFGFGAIAAVVGSTAEDCGSGLLRAVESARRVHETEPGRNRFNVDHHGEILVKKDIERVEELMKKVDLHTWDMVS